MTEQNASSNHPLSGSKRRLAALFLVVVCLCVYLIGVFLAAHTRSTTYFPKNSVAAKTYDGLSDDCRKLLTRASLNPHGTTRPPQYKEFGSIWQWESAATVMYSSELLRSPECFVAYANIYRLAIPSRRILVIYDVEQDRPVLVVRNFE